MKNVVLPEIVAIGIYNAQTAAKNREVTKSRKTTMFELELPIGDGGISYTDNDSVPITEDILICAKPGQLRHTRLPFKCYYIHMIVREGELCDMLMRMPTYIKIGEREPYEKIFSQICTLAECTSDADELLIHANILKLISLLCKHVSDIEIQSHTSNRIIIEDTVRYIKSNLSADLSLGTLAHRVSFSPVHFHNCFKKSTGRNLREFVEQTRLAHAVRLLCETDKTLTEIAYECGFSSQSYFSYTFKKRMKMTPREYSSAVYEKYEGRASQAPKA